MFNRGGATFYPQEAKYLDSPEQKDSFLSAINFQSSAKANNSNGETKSGLPYRPPTAKADKPAAGGVQSQNMPVMRVENKSESQNKVLSQNQAQSQYQAQSKPSSGTWRRTAAQPAPLAGTYWEQQRIAKGIANPWSYPSGNAAQTPSAYTVQANNSVNTSHQGVGNCTKNPVPSQVSGPVNDPNTWPLPDQASPANQSPNRSSRVSPNPNPWTRISSARGYRLNGLKQAPTSVETWSNEAGDRKNPTSAAGEIDRISPDLTGYRMPRPDRDYAGSTYSLPSLASELNVSDEGIGGKSTEDKSTTDIRNEIGLQPNIHVHRDAEKWTTYNWENPTGRDWDDILSGETYLSQFITAWMKESPENMAASLTTNVQEHWRCDIDTNTGKFLRPVGYPESMVNHAENDPALEWRRQNWTSTLLMRRHIGPPRASRNGKNNRRRNRRGRDWDDEPAVIDERLILKVHEHVIERPEYNRYVPRIPSFLRPAEKYDMTAVQAIYNWEVEHGMQALDTQPLSVEDFERILATAQNLGMPFIVAVRGSARDLGLIKGNLAFSNFNQVPFHESDKLGEILGFAFFSVWQPGLAGGGLGTSRATAKIHVFVHPDYRRNKIGFSLIDMLLTTVSDRFSSQTGYDFIDPDNSPVFKNSAARQRQYFHLYLSFKVKSKQRTNGNKKLEDEQKAYDDDLAWVKTLVEDQLNFTQMVRLEAVHRSPKGAEGPAYWMDEIIFEHTCHFDPLAIKGEY